MSPNSAIPETVQLLNALCPFCGAEQPEGTMYDHIMMDDGCDSAYDTHRSPQAAIQTLLALEPPALAEALKVLAAGTEFALVPREAIYQAGKLLHEARTIYKDDSVMGMTWEPVRDRWLETYMCNQEES